MVRPARQHSGALPSHRLDTARIHRGSRPRPSVGPVSTPGGPTADVSVRVAWADDADAVADVVSTGTTLRQAGLEIFGPVILQSEAVLITGPSPAEGAETLLRRLRGIMVARRYVMVDYDLPADLVDAAVAIAGGVESPTISPLRDPAWVAVRVMVARGEVNQVMDALYALGARAILVTAIHNARL